MNLREGVACGFGVMRLGIDAGIAVVSMALAVPVGFAIGEGAAMARANPATCKSFMINRW